MRRTSISPIYLYILSLEFVKARKKINCSGRGRPRKYPDAFILTIASLKELFGFSYREVLEFVGWFWKDIPSLSDFHYRLSNLNKFFLKEFISFLSFRLIKNGLLPQKYIIDGTETLLSCNY